jgi:hypothetical protein
MTWLRGSLLAYVDSQSWMSSSSAMPLSDQYLTNRIETDKSCDDASYMYRCEVWGILQDS